MLEMIVMIVASILGLFLAFRAFKFITKGTEQIADSYSVFMYDFSTVSQDIEELKEYMQIDTKRERCRLDQLEQDTKELWRRVNGMRGNNVKRS